MLNRRSCAWIAWIVLFTAAGVSAADPQPVYLTDWDADLLGSNAQTWGVLGRDTAAKPTAEAAGVPLKIQDKTYQHGLGHHASGEILVDLWGKYQTFLCDVGVQRQNGQNLASVVFQIFVDGEKRFDSGVMHENDPPRPVSISVAGADALRLVLTDAGDGINCDMGDWADARLIPATTVAPRRPLSAKEFLDVAGSAQVVSSDPQRMEGTKANRTEEFPADDLKLTTAVAPRADGCYVVPQGKALGLEWFEDRELAYVALEFAEGGAPADLKAVQVQYWSGESPWQGSWKPLRLESQCEGRVVGWPVRYRESSGRMPRIRWIFPASDQPLVVKRFQALTRDRVQEVTVSLECEAPHAGASCPIEVYNGTLLEPKAEGRPAVYRWDTRKPAKLRVQASVPNSMYKGDRTLLRVAMPTGMVTLAVEDLLQQDCIYVPAAGLFAVRQPAPVSLAEYKQRIAGKKSILDDVRSRPDQTLAQAMAVTRNPIQDLGPVMLSLACDNRKFVAYREGNIDFERYEQPDDNPPVGLPKQCQLLAKLGSQPATKFTRAMEGGWLPIVLHTSEIEGLRYRQRTYVAPLDAQAPSGTPAWLRDRAAGVVEYEIENPGDQPSEALVELSLKLGEASGSWKASGSSFTIAEDGRLLALADSRGAAPLKAAVTEAGTLRVAGRLPAKGHASLVVLLPAWKTTADEVAQPLDATKLRADTAEYWKQLMEPGMQVEVPDAFLTNLLRASQVHCLLAARNEKRGSLVSAWIGSDRYGPLESEANSILLGMGRFGQEDFARCAFDFFLARYNAAGYLTTGYTLTGTGWNLWTLAEQVQRTGDLTWFKQAAPTVVRACQWLVAQRAKTKLLGLEGEKLPGYGMVPPGVSADWNRYGFRFFNDAHYCAGLTTAAEMLKAIGDPAADELLRDAAAYRKDVAEAFHWTQVRSPVVALQDGTWTYNHPGIVGFFGNVEEFTPGVDGGRSWCYSVDLGSHYLTALGVLEPRGADSDAIVNYLEDHQFLRGGWCEYPEDATRKDPFNFGGFAKVQPYYCRIAEVHALRDDVKPFIRTYFNSLAAMVSTENLSFWEHFHNVAAWNKTHETGWFLAQSYLMFVQERGDELWLAPFVTDQWTKDGLRVKVERAPTRFGTVGYEIHSLAGQGAIEATVTPPTRLAPKAIVLRLRHPDGKKIRRVLVDGQASTQFDAERDTITLPASQKVIRVRAEY